MKNVFKEFWQELAMELACLELKTDARNIAILWATALILIVVTCGC